MQTHTCFICWHHLLYFKNSCEHHANVQQRPYTCIQDDTCSATRIKHLESQLNNGIPTTRATKKWKQMLGALVVEIGLYQLLSTGYIKNSSLRWESPSNHCTRDCSRDKTPRPHDVWTLSWMQRSSDANPLTSPLALWPRRAMMWPSDNGDAHNPKSLAKLFYLFGCFSK